MTVDLTTYLRNRQALVNQSLEAFFTPSLPGLESHFAAMRYSLLGGGKRIRPILCLAAAEAIRPTVDSDTVLPFACALECIHTYSLIHDDLPAMDDDDLRRGRLTCHKKFGEAAAILAGDGLLTMAFEIMAAVSTPPSAETRLRIIGLVARAAGPLGMVGGQVMDLDCEGRTVGLDTLRRVHEKKTGALLTASVQAGALAAGCDNERFQAITVFGGQIGLAFQIVDDLLDVTATTEQLGKTAGADESRRKATYPALVGITETRARARQAVDDAIHALANFTEHADPLRELARFIEQRTH